MAYKKVKKLISERKRRICELDAESIAFYRRNPCIACEDLLGIRLIDSQKYILQESWNKPHVLWCCSRNFGKSFLGAVFMILKAVLYENQAIYIVSSVGNQSKETFSKIEEIVLRIGKTAASIDSLQDIIEKETVKSTNNKTGFQHNPESFHVSFYNGIEIFTLNGKPDNNRSKPNIYIFIIENKSIWRNLIMNPRWNKDEINYLKENYHSISINEISEHLNRKPSAIHTKACKLKITNNGAWADEEIEYLKSNYQTKTYKELSKELHNRTKAAIDLKINKLGLHKSKYNYDHDFFEVIDSEEKAYWLGFFYADGCVSINKETNSGECCIKLYKGDYRHLQKFNKSLNGNIPVLFETSICTYNNKPQETGTPRRRVESVVAVGRAAARIFLCRRRHAQAVQCRHLVVRRGRRARNLPHGFGDDSRHHDIQEPGPHKGSHPRAGGIPAHCGCRLVHHTAFAQGRIPLGQHNNSPCAQHAVRVYRNTRHRLGGTQDKRKLHLPAAQVLRNNPARNFGAPVHGKLHVADTQPVNSI